MPTCPLKIEIGKVIMGQFQISIESCDHIKKAKTILTPYEIGSCLLFERLWLQCSTLAPSIDQDIHDPTHNRVPVAVSLVNIELFIVFVVVSIGSDDSVAATVDVVVVESHDR